MKSKYLTPLWLEDIDGNNWILAADFIYQSELLNGTIVVPVMTETDLASIPKILRGILPKSGRYNKAAVLHDAGYHGKLKTYYPGQTHTYREKFGERQRIHLVKDLCDKLFLEAMHLSGVTGIEARFMYDVVSVFGNKDESIEMSPERKG